LTSGRAKIAVQITLAATINEGQAAYVAGNNIVNQRASKSPSIFKITAFRHSVANCLVEKTQQFATSK
jgi:hypothetical protein